MAVTRRFVRSGNGHGAWSIMDMVLGYRICNYHPTQHGGVHVHVEPGGEVVGVLPSISLGRAEGAMRRYARHHRAFDLRALRQEVRLWRSR